MRFKLGKIANTIFTAIAGGLITILVTNITEQDQNRTRFLDYSVESKTIFESDSKVPKDKIKVIVNDDIKNPVQEVGQIDFAVYNLSDKDFDKVQIFIEFKQKGKGKPLRIISQEIPTEYKDSTKLSASQLPSNSTRKYSYNIDILNRSSFEESSKPDHESSEFASAFGTPVKPVFKATYTIVGERVSNIEIIPSVKLKGVKLREISYDSVREYEVTSEANWWNLLMLRFPILQLLPILALLFFFVYVYHFILCLFLRVRIYRQEKELDSQFTEFFKKSNTLNQLRSMSDPKDIAQELTKINRQIRNQEIDTEIFAALIAELSEPEAINKFQQFTVSEVIEILLKIDPNPMKYQLNFWEWLRMGMRFY